MAFVHSTPEKSENVAFFLRLGLPSTLTQRNCPPKTELFENTLQIGGHLRTPAFQFSVDGKRIENGVFSKM